MDTSGGEMDTGSVEDVWTITLPKGMTHEEFQRQMTLHFTWRDEANEAFQEPDNKLMGQVWHATTSSNLTRLNPIPEPDEQQNTTIPCRRCLVIG